MNPSPAPSAPRTEGKSTNLLEVKDLKKWFPIRGGILSRVVANVKAINGVSFSVKKGEVLGLVGESGSGKTTVGRTILRLIEPTEGSIKFNGQEITTLSKAQLRPYRRKMQIIFQDPYASLNPRMRAGDIVAEPLRNFDWDSRHGNERVTDLFHRVGLNAEAMKKYPHEFSGGQRQRLGIARALALNPRLIVCDEPVSALDVSIQAQVINLLEDLQADLGLSYIFVAHDLAVVRHISHRVAVMYLGRIVEIGPVDTIFAEAKHPYTRALLSAVPKTRPQGRSTRILLKGDLPNPANPPSGCTFRTRCPQARPECAEHPPQLRDNGSQHLVSCHFA